MGDEVQEVSVDRPKLPCGKVDTRMGMTKTAEFEGLGGLIPLSLVVFAVLLGLKIAGLTSMGWAWVLLAPLWFPVLLLLATVVAVLVLLGVVAALTWAERLVRQ